MLWECYSLIASEVWPERILQSLMSSDQWRQRKKVFAELTCAHPPNGSSETDWEELHHTVLPQAGSVHQRQLIMLWYEVVIPRLQAAELTYIDDKLPCIRGIAEMFKEAIGCDYLAGHWKLGLIESLGWQPSPAFECTNATPAAPSWSMASVNGGTSHGFFGDLSGFSPLASLLEASSISADDRSASIPGITGQCRLRVKGFAHRLGVDANESICGQKCHVMYLNLGTPWLPGYWGSRDEFSDRVRQPRYGYPKWVPDKHRGNEIEELTQWHRDTEIGNGCLVTVRKESAPLYSIALNGSRAFGTNRISGIIAKQVSEESDGPVLERIGHWSYLLSNNLEAARVDVEILQQYEKQRIFYLV